MTGVELTELARKAALEAVAEAMAELDREQERLELFDSLIPAPLERAHRILVTGKTDEQRAGEPDPEPRSNG